jgi:DnaJ like chaperone protein
VQWFGKAIGAALGLAVGGPWGGVVGALLGHQFDQGLGGTVKGGSVRARDTFFATTFEIMGHVAKIDGRVSEEEIQIARRIMHAMRLGPDEVRLAIGHFTAGKQPDYPMQQRVDELARRIGQRRELARTFVELQVQAAVGAGDIAQSKRELLWVIARSLGLSRVELAQIEATFRGQQHGARPGERQPDLGDAYRMLGIDATASDKEVKTAYRRLMNQHHPDKLVSKGLPESMISVAEARTQQVRAAYDRVKSERGFK